MLKVSKRTVSSNSTASNANSVVYCDYFDSPQTFHGTVCMCVACSILLSAAVCSLYSSYTLLLYCSSGVLMSAVFMCSGSFLILYIKSHALYSD